VDLKNQRYISDTGQIHLDAKQVSLKVITLKSEAFVINDKKSIRVMWFRSLEMEKASTY